MSGPGFLSLCWLHVWPAGYQSRKWLKWCVCKKTTKKNRVLWFEVTGLFAYWLVLVMVWRRYWCQFTTKQGIILQHPGFQEDNNCLPTGGVYVMLSADWFVTLSDGIPWKTSVSGMFFLFYYRKSPFCKNPVTFYRMRIIMWSVTQLPRKALVKVLWKEYLKYCFWSYSWVINPIPPISTGEEFLTNQHP